MDKPLLAIHVRAHLDVGGQRLLHFHEGLVDGFGEVDGGCAGLFGDGQDHAGLAVVGCHARAGHFVANAYVGNVAQHHGPVVRAAHNGFAQRFKVGRGADAAHDIFVAVFIEYAARGVEVHVFNGCLHIGQRNAVGAHSRGVELYLVLLGVATDNRNLCHTARSQQSGSHSPVGHRAEVAQRSLVGCHSYEHEFAEYGRLRSHGRLADAFGQLVGDGRQLFGNYLARAVDVHAPVEFHPYDGESRGRRRAHTAHIGRAIDGCLDGEGYESLHFFGGHTARFGHHNHRRGIKVGKHIHVHLHSRIVAAHHPQNGAQQHEEAVGKGETDYLVKHYVQLGIRNEELGIYSMRNEE